MDYIIIMKENYTRNESTANQLTKTLGDAISKGEFSGLNADTAYVPQVVGKYIYGFHWIIAVWIEMN